MPSNSVTKDMEWETNQLKESVKEPVDKSDSECATNIDASLKVVKEVPKEDIDSVEVSKEVPTEVPVPTKTTNKGKKKRVSKMRKHK